MLVWGLNGFELLKFSAELVGLFEVPLENIAGSSLVTKISVPGFRVYATV